MGNFSSMGMWVNLDESRASKLLPKCKGRWIVAGSSFQQKAHLIQVETWIFDPVKETWMRHLSFFSKALWDRGQRPFIPSTGAILEGELSVFFGSMIPRCTWSLKNLKIIDPQYHSDLYPLPSSDSNTVSYNAPSIHSSTSSLLSCLLSDLSQSHSLLELIPQLKEHFKTFPLLSVYPCWIQGKLIQKEHVFLFEDQHKKRIQLLGDVNEISQYFEDRLALNSLNASSSGHTWFCLFAHPCIHSSSDIDLQWSLAGIPYSFYDSHSSLVSDDSKPKALH